MVILYLTLIRLQKVNVLNEFSYKATHYRVEDYWNMKSQLLKLFGETSLRFAHPQLYNVKMFDNSNVT